MSAYSSWRGMQRVQAKAPEESPATRSELHCWLAANLPADFPLHWNMFKEGPTYALRVGRVVSATYVRSLAMASFGWWRQQILDLAENKAQTA